MRYSFVTIAAALTLLCAGTALQGQRPDDQINARSVALLDQARAARSSGNIDGAIDMAETALAVDPRNRAAYVLLGDIAQLRGLHGKAIRLYREALLLEPNDRAALKGQGEALVQKGALKQANATLAKLKAVCGKSACDEVSVLTGVIAKGPPVATAAVKEMPGTVPPKQAEPAKP